MELTCPKCHGTMRTYERNGVHVDQCTDCRGIFLDRGELERLVDAENDWHGGAARSTATSPSAASAAAAAPPAGEYEAHRQSGPSGTAGQLGAVVSEVLKQARGSQHGSQHGYGTPQRKKKESFLSDLFG
jgi:Zn-finger nucleic acid-binding protein